jgi:hypothetical protein
MTPFAHMFTSAASRATIIRMPPKPKEPDKCSACDETIEDCETGGEFSPGPTCQYGKNRVAQRKRFEQRFKKKKKKPGPA